MTLRGSVGSARTRGTPLVLYVTALVLVPMLGVLALVGVTLHAAIGTSDSAAAASRSVATVILLERVQSSIEQEVIPVLTVAGLHSPELVARLGIPPDFLASARTQANVALQTARTSTDQTLSAVPADSEAAPSVAAVRSALQPLRSSDVSERTFNELLDTYQGYQRLSSDVARERQLAEDSARDEDVSGATRSAIDDVAKLSRFGQAASVEIPLFFLSSDFGGTNASPWLAAHAEYRAAVTGLDTLSQSEVRSAWARISSAGPVRLVAGSLEGQTLPGAAPLSLLQQQELAGESQDRNTLLSDLLNVAVGRAEALAIGDRRDAQTQTTRAILLALGQALVTAAVVGVVWRSLSRSLHRLAGRAQDVSRGTLVDVEVDGPREVRTVSAALRSTVASLRRIQDQAGAVARGDLDHALLDEPLPGPLGEVVHASVQRIVVAVRQRQELQFELARQAEHDSLTELPNRAQALRLVSAALQRAQRAAAVVGLLFIDLDGFKAVNDGFGHAAGDEVLRQTAHRLGSVVRSGSVVCRLGGDEFVVLVEPAESEEDLVSLSQRLIETVSRPIGIGGTTVTIGASIGIATSRSDSIDAEALLAQADTAVYRAKDMGRGRAEVFDDALRAQLLRRKELEAAITVGLAAGEMRLVYQPVLDVATASLIGYEALIRWQRPGHGTLQPAQFIDAAEASPLICDLDRWVLMAATTQLARWRTGSGPAQPGEPTIAVNISGRHLLDSRIVADVAAALAASSLPAELLVLEITETVLVNDLVAYDRLAALQATGVRIAIDDFGTGYTSIAQLRNLPVNIIKIDRSFMASKNPSDSILVNMMIQAGHAFGLVVIAEGVEEAAQLAVLRSQSCDQAQGYLLARPLPAEQAHRSGGTHQPWSGPHTVPGPSALTQPVLEDRPPGPAPTADPASAVSASYG